MAMYRYKFGRKYTKTFEEGESCPYYKYSPDGDCILETLGADGEKEDTACHHCSSCQFSKYVKITYWAIKREKATMRVIRD